MHKETDFTACYTVICTFLTKPTSHKSSEAERFLLGYRESTTTLVVESVFFFHIYKKHNYVKS